MDDNYFIVMAYIAGKTLGSVIKAGREITPRKAANAIRKIAYALEEAHQQGVIHRDLKPANIMIDKSGEPVVMDFGLARRNTSGDVALTHSGAIMGTPAYMPPEQARGNLDEIGPASDIYSLGVILYELLCDRRPFKGPIAEVMAQILYQPPKPPSAHKADVDPKLEAICLKAMSKQKQDRYQSMAELAEALTDYLRVLRESGEGSGSESNESLALRSLADSQPLPAMGTSGQQAAPEENSGKFDPYHKWLGIPRSEQPPNHYRLLGLQVFEKDLDVIASAAERQMAYIHQLAAGPHVEESQKLLNELAAARLCLLAPERKAAYDKALEVKLETSKTQSKTDPAQAKRRRRKPARQPVEEFDDFEEAPLQKLSSRRKQQSSQTGPAWLQNRKIIAAIAGGIALLMGAILLAVVVFSIKTADGTVVVEFTDADNGATFSLDGEEQFTLTTPDDDEPVTFEIAPGEHKFNISKEGFETQADRFEIKSGGEVVVKVHLVPLSEEPPKKVIAKKDDPPAEEPSSEIPAEESPTTNPAPMPKVAVVTPPVTDNSNTPPPAAIAPFDTAQAQKHQRAWAEHLETSLEKTNSVGMKLRLIPPGNFQMGASAEEEAISIKRAKDDRSQSSIRAGRPQHQVTISKPYYLGVHEVTHQQYEEVMGKTNRQLFKPGGIKNQVDGHNTNNHPMNTVSWIDAIRFCNRLSARDGLKPCYNVTGKNATPIKGNGYRLPTEAEWEFACRAGTDSEFYFGDDLNQLKNHAWFAGNSENRTHEVGNKTANPFGLHDMYGNVWEWCQDRFGPKYYWNSSALDPAGSPTGKLRTVRGGDWYFDANYCRSAGRRGVRPNAGAITNGGFRVQLVSVQAESEQPRYQPRANETIVAEYHAASRLLPGKLGWEFVSETLPERTIANLKNGVLRHETSMGNRSTWRQMVPQAKLSPFSGAFFETRAKILVERHRNNRRGVNLVEYSYWKPGGACGITVYGQQHQLVVFDIHDKIVQTIPMDTTDRFHTYRSEFTNNDYRLLVDGREVASGTSFLPDASITPQQRREAIKRYGDGMRATFGAGSAAAETATDRAYVVMGIVSPRKSQTAVSQSPNISQLTSGRWQTVLTTQAEITKNLQGNATAPLTKGGFDLRDSGYIVAHQEKLSDAMIRVRLKKAPKGHCILHLRIGSTGNYSAGFSRTNRFGVAKWVNGEGYHPLKSVRTKEHHTGYFDWTFAAVGNVLTVTVNGKEILRVQDDSHKTGLAGIGVVKNENEALFKKVEVKSLDDNLSSSSLTTFKNTWTNLLNDDNLDGWQVGGRQKRGRGKLKWTVENGVLSPVSGIQTSIQTEREFADYDLKFDYRLNKGAKGAVFLRTPPGLVATPRRDLAIQLIDNDSEIPGRGRQTALPTGFSKNGSVAGFVAPSADAGNPVGEWNQMEIQIRGLHVTVILNGQQIVSSQIDTTPNFIKRENNKATGKSRRTGSFDRLTGSIAFWRHKGNIDFAKIQVRELKPVGANKKSNTSLETTDPDRAAAQWALSIGGSVHLQNEAGKILHFGPGNTLPKTPFRVVQMSLHKRKAVHDDNLPKLAGLTALKTLSLFGTSVGDRGIAQLAKVTSLEELILTNTKVTNRGLETLSGLTNLTILSLAGTGITDEGIPLLSTRKKLQRLSLNNTKVTDRGLAELRSLSQLTGLGLVRTKITDAGLAHLSGLTNLTYLGLNQTLVTDAGLKHLRSLKKVQQLDLRRTSISDAGLQHLKDMTAMQRLNLSFTKISDVGLEHLAGMKALQRFSLSSTAVEGPGLIHLAAAEGLRVLYLNQTKMQDVGMSALEQFPNLMWFSIADTQVTAAGLPQLWKMETLTELGLPTGLTDEDIKDVTKLQNLRWLYLRGDGITDGALEHVKQLPNLKTLRLTNTSATDAGLAEFKTAKPNCFVKYIGEKPTPEEEAAAEEEAFKSDDR